MKKKCGLFVLVILKTINLFSQEYSSKQDSIAWHRGYHLAWSDFMGRPDTSSNSTAGCAASIYVKGFRDNGLPNFLVSNSFIKKEAWTKDTTSVILLQHEQLHFDIAEVYARKIRKSIELLRRKKINAVEAYTVEIQKLLKIRIETDTLYDEQTSHGINGNAQSSWKKKILKELDALNEYAVKSHL